MSQSTNLYMISKLDFEEFSKNPESYNLVFDDCNSSVFDQNFEGLYFLFSSFYKDQLPEFLEKLFYPKDYIGEAIDYGTIDFDDFDALPESKAIYYLDSLTVKEIAKALKTIKKEALLEFYNADKFNANDVYPHAWHNDESENQAFNKRHLKEGLELLEKTFTNANIEDNYILFFSA